MSLGMREKVAAVAIVSVSLIGATVAQAADMEQPAYGASTPASGPTNEVRFGVLYHDLMDEESGVDISGEYLSRFAAFDFTTPFLGTQSMLRPHIGFNLNLMGDTSMAYAGYSLTVDLNDYLFVEGSFGGMVHNGKHVDPTNQRLSLGCSVMFRESASIGAHITGNWNVLATIEHASNAGLCDVNNGVTNVGMKLGYAF